MIFDRRNKNERKTILTRSSTPNNYHDQHYSRNPRNILRSITPHRKSSGIRTIFSYQKNQSTAKIQIAEKFEEIFQAASLDTTMTNELFSNYCKLFELKVVEIVNTPDGSTQLGSSSQNPLIVSIKSQLYSQNHISLEYSFY